MKNLVQIGSGSANLDDYIQDGFTNFVNKKKKNFRLFLVEANSIHIRNLRKNWKSKKGVKIFNFAIIPDDLRVKKIDFFYSLDDKPFYQIFSNSRKFVKKHFPKSVIRKKKINCKNITNFLIENSLKKIEFLCLDIEGMDFEVLYKMNLKRFNIKNISFEHLHLSFWQKCLIVKKLINNGYDFSGMGFDLRKSDWMFSKTFKRKNFRTFLLPITPRRVWKKFPFSKLI
tara:strand:+ start:521 stop:1204 length:684 start_codon:yes stop_codon:yes gene_type:complete